MLQLPLIEKVIFYFVLLFFAGAAAAGTRSISHPKGKSKLILTSLIILGVLLEVAILAIRGASIDAVPLTGLFEFMIILTIVFALTFLFLSEAIPQVWFAASMGWIILAMAIQSAFVANPATQINPAVQTPWIIVHGFSMVAAGSMITFSASMAALFLLSRKRLKQKQITMVIGKMPTIDRLQRLNVIGLKISFIILTLGMASGIGIAVAKSDAIGMRLVDWLTDSKTVIISVAWLLIAAVLVLGKVVAWKGKRVAWITIAAFLLILFALIGARIFCKTKHDFSNRNINSKMLTNVDKRAGFGI